MQHIFVSTLRTSQLRRWMIGLVSPCVVRLIIDLRLPPVKSLGPRLGLCMCDFVIDVLDPERLAICWPVSVSFRRRPFERERIRMGIEACAMRCHRIVSNVIRSAYFLLGTV